jgi:hypothetical protein
MSLLPLPDGQPGTGVRVASVSASHVYVRHIASPDPDLSVVRLSDPRPCGAPHRSGRWWPPVMLEPAWVSSHCDDFDVFHMDLCGCGPAPGWPSMESGSPIRTGRSVMPRGSSSKRERQYEHVKESAEKRGASKTRAKEIAARTVNKERARSGESKTASRTSTRDTKSAPNEAASAPTPARKGPPRTSSTKRPGNGTSRAAPR